MASAKANRSGVYDLTIGLTCSRGQSNAVYRSSLDTAQLLRWQIVLQNLGLIESTCQRQ